MNEEQFEGIAIIGMTGRFPGAESVEEFWANLVAGRESITFFSDAELAESGLDPEALRRRGKYIPARGVLKDADCFDAAFFGIHPKEAEVMDPQQRLFLEACWTVLERAGYAPDRLPGAVGVFGGMNLNTYYQQILLQRPELLELVGSDLVMLGNEKDYLTTRVAYKLGLNGPAINVSTACSTSLVAVGQACQSLLTYQCDMALAGGAAVRVPQKSGYFYDEGNIGSADGHTRTFDEQAAGTAFSNGVAVVALKRLENAVQDGDSIYAVIKAAALNNDGSQRVSFGAPGVEGQSKAIAMAQALAGVDPETITCVEAHGTATPLGDPIEVAALTKAFRLGTQARNFCALGSVKTNVGHLDAAAGVTGLIKTALSLHHKILPASLHFTKPNPKLDLENSPFYINASLQEWKTKPGLPRRAGVSSFGTGGTNAHLILEEAPEVPPSGPSRPWQLFILSAKTPEALDRATVNLAGHLKQMPVSSAADAASRQLADAAFTLQTGRSEFAHRRIVACRDAAEGGAALEARDPKRVFTSRQKRTNPPVVFMFPGQGAQYPGMGARLYRSEPVFRAEIDRCAEWLRPILATDLRPLLFPGEGGEKEAEQRLVQTRFTQPALFVIEYALAKLWMSWGIRPAAMIGHSVGEYTAACLSGVFGLEDALTLVARRGELIQAQPGGSMLSIRLPEEEVRPLLTPPLALAAVNSPHLCVVSGPHDEIAALEKLLESRGVTVRHLHTSHAFHSPMMDPVIEPFTALLRGMSFGKPVIPFVSNVTARWITDGEAGSPEYWAGHVRQTVRFADGIGELLKDAENVLLEVGPGQTLTTLSRQYRSSSAEQIIIPSLPLAGADEERGLLEALGRLWMAGRAIDWAAFQAPERRLRVVLPTYPFERKRFWPEPAAAPRHVSPEAPVLEPPTPAIRPAGTDPQPAAARRDRLFAEARSLLQELSGYDLSGVDPSANFLELGLDSLLLTQAAQLFQRKFGVTISFRHLMEELSSLDAIAAHLDEVLPADAFAPAPAAPPAAPLVPTEAAPGGTLQNPSLEQLWRQQQELTQQLLQLMGRSPAVAAAPSSLAAAAIPTAQAAAAPAKPEVKTHGPFKPIDKSAGAALSPKQSRALEALIARYVKRTAGSKKYTDQYRPVLADPRSVSGFNRLWKEMVYPIITARSDGSKVWDIDGNEYIDFVMGFGASMFGHRPPFVVQAVHEQLDRGFEIGPLQLLAGEVATLISEMTGMPRVAFTNTGSEAVLAATRVCRTVTGRDKIAVFAGAYHGIFDEVLFRPLTVNGETRTAPIAPGIPNSALSQVIVLDYGNPQSLDILRRRGPEIAAVLVEPVQSRRLDLQPREFLQELRRVTQETGSALIFDEVVTGFRVHPGGAQAHFDVRADLATYGKVIGGGLPIGVVSGQARFMDALDGGQWQYGDASFPEVGVTFFAGTFVRHPLVLAAAKAVLLHLKQKGPDLQRSLTERTARVASRMGALIDEFQAPYHLTQFSSIIQLNPASHQKYAGLLFYLLREHGIHIYENRAFIMTTAHGDDDLTRLTDVFKESLTEMRSSEFSSFGSVAAQAPTVAVGDSFPLTEAQKEIWYATQMGGLAEAAFNESITLRFDGPFREDHFREAVRQVLSRHGILRAHFSADGERQQIDAGLDPEIPKDDLSALAGEAREAALAALVDQESSAPFDLTRGHLVRFRIVKLGPESHRVIWTPHHIVCDGWSATIVLGELARIYSALSRGAVAALEEPTPYREYVALQSAQAESPEVLEALSYWKRQFADPPPALDLPSDRPRPPIRSFRASTLSLTLTEAILAALKKTAAGQRTTLVVLMMAAVKTLLFRLSGGSDLVIGLPVAEQAMIGKHHLIGHCVNLLPIRTSLTAEMPFREYLGSVKQALLDAYDHQQSTFGTIVQHLPLPRVPGRSPLVDVLFNIDRDLGGIEFEGLKFAAVRNPKKAMNFDFFFNFTEGSHGLELQCDYNTDLFDESTVRRWLGHLQTLLEGIIARPDQTLGELPLLDQAERRRILVEWNQTRREYAQDRGVQRLFEAQAERSAGQCAVICGTSSLTYAELNARANQLAHHLQTLGIRSESLVGLYIERSLDMVVAVLAVLKAGGAYVPLDPTYPPERLAYMLADTETPVIITQKRLSDAQGLPPHQAQMVYLDSEWDLIARCSADNPTVDIKPEHLAYVLFTSGSTGKPKGVQISHRGLTNLITSVQHEPGLGAADTLLSVTTLSFDIAELELYLPLTVGARIMIASREDAVDARRLIDLLGDSRITAMQATPATWRMLLEAGWTGSPGLKIICGGETMTRDLANQLLARSASVWNGYGPTETTIYSTFYRVLPEEKAIAVPIGRPIANTGIYILDPRKQPVPIGVPGDLFISGEGVARGYLHQPELTADKFLPNPFASEPGARMYRTGDRASYRTNGNIDFLGRSDFQVKIRGYRIELGEVEAVLAGHPLIKQAVVILREDSPGEKRLVAYLVAAGSPNPAPQQVRDHVRSALPEYMVPGLYVFLPSLPLTPNGKIDRKALPRPDKDAAAAPTRFEPPASPLEQQLADLWSETLGVARIGRRDNFFDLGGHSLLAVKLFTRIERSFGKRLPLATLFRAPTLEQLARVLQPKDESPASWLSLVPIQPQGSKPPFFCVHGGAGNVLLFRHLAAHVGPDQPFYGLQAQGLDGKTKYATTVEEMAAHYLREIRQFQPLGPYFLGGYCMGGAVAYEIARRLQGEGETVAFLGMIDTYNPEGRDESRSFGRRLGLFRQKIRFHWENMAQLGPLGGSRYLVSKIALAKGRESARWAVKIGNFSKRMRLKPENRVFAVFLEDVNDRAGQAYQPQPWPGKITFFNPRSNYDSDIHFELGWGRLAQGGFELIELPMNPGGLFVEPYVIRLASELKGRLEKAQLASGRG